MYPFATYTMCTKCTNICTPSKANTRCKNWLPIFGTRYEQLIGSEEGLHQKMGIQVFTIWRKLFIYVYICCILYIYESDCTADGTMGPSMHQMVHLGLFRGMRPYYKVAAHCQMCFQSSVGNIYLQYANTLMLGHNIKWDYLP